jgi:hypothetical protein
VVPHGTGRPAGVYPANPAQPTPPGCTAPHIAVTMPLICSVMRDLCLIESCIGVGEVAVSDHRGSVPTPHDLAVLASEARVGGMLGGKAGLVHCHMGPGKALLGPLRDAIASSNGDLPITQVCSAPLVGFLLAMRCGGGMLVQCTPAGILSLRRPLHVAEHNVILGALCANEV